MANINYNGALIDGSGSIDLSGDVCGQSLKVTAVYDCANSIGTVGQVLSSTGTALEWITVSGTGTVTSITAGTGLTGGTITTSGTIALDTACVIQPSSFTALGDLLAGTGAGTYSALGVGTDGQVLTACSACASGLTWVAAGAAPATPTVAGVVLGRTTAGDAALGCNAFLTYAGAGASSVAIGQSALRSATTGSVNNVAIGNSSLCSVTTGIGNVGVGSQTGFNITTGLNNVAVGLCSQRGNSTGCRNVSVGTDSLRGITSGCDNIGIGDSAGFTTSVGVHNIAIGSCALCSNVNGTCNVAIGQLAMGSGGTTGLCNIAIGALSLSTMAGSNNIAVGVTAGRNLTAGCNTAVGAGAITGAVGGTATGTYNTAVGFRPLFSLTSGSRNVAVGDCAGAGVTTGGANVLIGCRTACKLDTGSCNVAIGPSAMYNTTSGSNNVALGIFAYCNGNGFGNIALGTNAGRNFAATAPTGNSNVFIGPTTGCAITTGAQNVIIGAGAGSGITTGCSNFIYQTPNPNTSVSTPVFNVTTENNRVVMGSTSVTNAYIQVTWTVVSDARDKIVEGPVPHGLEFVKQLEPKAFHFKQDRDSTTPYGPLRYGFLAQDIMALEGDSPVIIDNEDLERLKYNGEALVPVLVNAVKELAAKNAELEARILALEIPG